MCAGDVGTAAVATGVWSVRLPLPQDRPDHVVSYLVAGESDRLTIIDAGDGSPASWRALAAALSDINRSLVDVEAFVATHFHPDHVGMADRLLAGNSGMQLLMSDADRRGQEIGIDLEHHTQALLDDDAADFAVAVSTIERIAPQERAFTQLDDGRLLPIAGGLRVIGTPGHTSGHVCLFDERRRIVFVGDHILPDMHPSLAAPSPGLPHPLRSYRHSLQKVLDLRAECALPGHGDVITDIARRTAEHRAHHEVKSSRTLAALRGNPGTHAFALARIERRGQAWHALSPLQRWASFAKTWAHLVELRERGAVRLSSRAPVWTVIEERGTTWKTSM